MSQPHMLIYENIQALSIVSTLCYIFNAQLFLYVYISFFCL